ncbi:MAG: hypothetical protein CJBNEKGG_02494 [Prosthecobacter sp.]|nr:hypothetical protein [Prosthecobacter sp.]
MNRGWRSRLHYWSRRKDILRKTALSIVAGAFLLAWGIVQTSPGREGGPVMDPVEQSIRHEWRQLANDSRPDPRRLTHWLRKLTPSLALLAESLDMPEVTWDAYVKSGSILAYEVRELLDKHLVDPVSRGLAEDYLAACLAEDNPAGREASARLSAAAAKEDCPAHACELHASMLLRLGQEEEALAAMMKEAQRFPEAGQLRETAFRLALHLEDASKLSVFREKGWLEAMPGLLKHEAGVVLGDIGMQWHGLLQHRLAHLPLAAVCLTGLAAGLWYLLLVVHLPGRGWRWIWPLAPLLAGVASIWPTVSLIAFQQDHMGIDEEGVPFPLDLVHLIVGVGFREEVCKLALAAMFMPWLLRRRMPGMALMTGAFVGLGFAMEENIDYYQDMGGAVVLGRFLSANFMHVALTGLSTQALYDMLRTRFAQAPQFLTTLGALIVVHALYDYDAPELGGLESYMPMVILALLAWRFWDMVEAMMPGPRQTVAPAAIFLCGVALVTAGSLVITAIETGGWASVLDAARHCAGVLPVAVIYWRRFEGGLNAR